MAESGYMTLPIFHGTLLDTSHGSAAIRAGWRVYPMELGALVRTTTTTPSTTLLTHGKGEFAANDYLVVCAATAYGSGTLYIPDTTRIAMVSSVSGSDDALVLNQDFTCTAGEFLCNLSTDSASPSPTTLPNLDGSSLTLYTDNVGNNADSNPYVQTNDKGFFRRWLASGRSVVDVLLTDSSGNLMLVHPYFTLGTEILA